MFTDKLKMDWERKEKFVSTVGEVHCIDGEEWFAYVCVTRKGQPTLIRIDTTYGSAGVAMQAVERVWARENKK